MLLLVALAGGWWIGAGQFGATVDEWIAARRAEGYRIEAEPGRITGFPLRWVARYPSLSLAAPAPADGRPNWAWQGHAVTLSWSLFDRNRLHLGTSGTSSLDLVIDGEAHAFLVDSDRASLTLAAEPGRQQHATAQAEKLSLSGAGLALTAAGLEFDVVGDPAAPVDHTVLAGTLSLKMRDLALTQHGQAQPALTLSGTITAALMGKPPAGPPAAALAAWRDEGGTVELTRVALSSGAVAVKGSGTVALDGQMRPIGAGTASLQGVEEAVDRLVASGQMSARDAPLAKLAFNALARPDPETGARVVTLAVSAENGTLFLGPVKIATLRPLKLD